ncbi:MAG: DUF2851 family protein [Chitinophagaceae bacterium]|nr:DUF2851 family protein [Chitinophagaceae bacterium]
MTERLLQYIWQFQYYNRNELVTTTGERLAVVHPGTFNRHQGPDFSEGKILMDDHLWVGNIELHLLTSDWQRHGHDSDDNYNNVILHVVWEDDEEERMRKFPTLELNSRVPKVLLEQYEIWMSGDHFIPCQASAALVGKLIWTGWKERMVVERLERKAQQVMMLAKRNNYHWEEVFWWMIAKNFGLYVNADAFEEMAFSIPHNLLSKHRLQIHQLEAMMFGQSRLLEKDFVESYPVMLKKEYAFLQSKYHLQQIHLPMHFLRMRPACFPTVRIAQLAMLVHMSGNIFSDVLSADSMKSLRNLLSITANDYWHYHFRFDEEVAWQPKTLGAGMISNILMNTVSVMLYAYGTHHKELLLQQRAIDWIGQLPAESNSVIAKFREMELPVKTAFDSQALIELKSQYCDRKRCLDCAIGSAVLSNRLPYGSS